MKLFLGCMVAVFTALASVQAQTSAVAAVDAAAVVVGETNAPAGSTTQTVAVAAVEIPEAAPEWIGYVRVLRDDQLAVRAIRLVVGDKLMAVDLNDKALELAKTPKTVKVLVKGALEMRDDRPWLVVSEFKEAPEVASVPPLPPVVPALTNAPEVPVNTNAPAGPASTNASPETK